MFDKDSLHHAYFIEGESVAVLADIESFLKEAFDIVRQANPDVHYAVYESFGIDEGRALQDMQMMKSMSGGKKIFIVAAGSITSEAQNALLKVFEEPTPGTHFFVISSSAQVLLPTLRSRMVVISHQSARKGGGESAAQEFIGMSPKERLVAVAEMIEEKDRAGAEDFLHAVVAELHKKKTAKSFAAIKEIVSFSQYLKDRASSIKLILERVALLDL